jgi:hypothetical protein
MYPVCIVYNSIFSLGQEKTHWGKTSYDISKIANIFFRDKRIILNVVYRECIIGIMHQKLWEYRVEEKLHLGVCKQKGLNASGQLNKFLSKAMTM